MIYADFARYYDMFTHNVNYEKRAAYFIKLFENHGLYPSSLLDLACGTGSLSYLLAEKGYTVVAADGSPQMLTQAVAKKDSYPNANITFILQDMEDISIPHQVDGVICALDSINHLTSTQAIKDTFSAVADSLVGGGLFAFDVNTLHKHKDILADNAFVFEQDNVMCVWQNSFFSDELVTQIQLDFFEENQQGFYVRSQDIFEERFYSRSILTKLLEETGFTLEGVYSEDSFDSPKPEDERLVYLARYI